jgi:transcriptional regulator with XRE-family HTH domain
MNSSRKPTDDDVRLGRLLQDLRKRAGKTQAELARQLGMTQQQLGKYERGESGLRIVTAARISDAVGVPGRVFFDLLQPAGFAESPAPYLTDSRSQDLIELDRALTHAQDVLKRLKSD